MLGGRGSARFFKLQPHFNHIVMQIIIDLGLNKPFASALLCTLKGLGGLVYPDLQYP